MEHDNNPLDAFLLRLRYDAQPLAIALGAAAAALGVSLLLPDWAVLVLAVLTLAGSLALGR